IVNREVRQELADRRRVQITRMPLAVKEYEPPNPAAISFFGSTAEMSEACNLRHLVEQLLVSHVCCPSMLLRHTGTRGPRQRLGFWFMKTSIGCSSSKTFYHLMVCIGRFFIFVFSACKVD